MRKVDGLFYPHPRLQGFYRYLNVATLPCSLIPTPPDDEQSPDIFHLQEDFA